MRYSISILVLMFAVSPVAVAQTVGANVSVTSDTYIGNPAFLLDFEGSSTWFSVAASSTSGFADVAYLDTDLGQGRRWYDAAFGQSFSCDTVDTFELIGDNDGSQTAGTVTTALGSDFYLAINTGGFDANLMQLYDEFGWVRLNVDQSLNLTAIDGAVSLGNTPGSCAGIVIGVPEPNAGSLALFVAVGFMAIARRTRRVCGPGLA